MASEQLVLPGGAAPIATNTASPVANKKSGVDLGDKAAEASEPRKFQGSGDFVEYAPPKPTASDTPPRDGVSINLVGASISEAAKTILGDLLKVNYAISDKVKASITLQTARPVAKDALLDIFESVLRAEGAVISVEGGVYKILPLDDALAAGPQIRQKNSSARGVVGITTQIVPLRFVSATEMERILKSVVPQATILRADTARNLLVISGTKGDLGSAIDAITIFDTDYMKGMSFAILPVETADPDAMAQELDTVFANDREGPTKGVVRFIPNKRLKALLVITSRPEYLDKARSWVNRLDLVGRATEKQVYTYRVQSRPATELATLVQRVYSPEGRGGGGSRTRVTSTTTTGSTSGGSSLGDVKAIPSVAIPNATGGGATSTTDVSVASGGLGAADPGLGGPGDLGGTGGQRSDSSASTGQDDDRFAGISIVPDEANNVLIITATPSQFKRVKQILDRIDLTPNQVLLEATIAEVTLNDQLKYGLRWFFSKGASDTKLTDSAAGVVSAAFPGFSYFLNTPNFQVALNALSTVTDVNVVSSPSLMVLDNKKAALQVGDEVPVATQSAVSVTTPGAPIVNSVSFRNTGVILNITPRVGDHGRILLEIEQEVSDVVPTTTSNIDSPTIQQRRVKTTVSVNDGESILLAGLIQDNSSLQRGQIPIAGEIPFFGNLFKNKTNIIKRTELLIAITPTVIKDNNQIRGITAEFRDKLNFTTRPQRLGPPDRKEQVDRLLVR